MRLAFLTVLCVTCFACGGTTESKNSARLASLAPSVGQIVPPFSPEQRDYTVEEDHLVANLTLEVSAEGNGEVTLDGAKTLQQSDGQSFELYIPPGSQDLTFKVSGPGLEQGSYHLRVTRATSLGQTYVKAESPGQSKRFGNKVTCAPEKFAVTEFGAEVPHFVHVFAGATGSTLSQQAIVQPDSSGATFEGAALDGDLLAVLQGTPDVLRFYRGSAGGWQPASAGSSELSAPEAVLALSNPWLAVTTELPRGSQVTMFHIAEHAEPPVVLTAPNAKIPESLGASLALAGTVLVAGSPYEASSAGATVASKNQDAVDSGAAYVFELDASGIWQMTAFLKASDAKTKDHFGQSVSVGRGRILVGADGQAAGEGAVYVFEKVGGLWTETAQLKRQGATQNDAFGSKVAMGEGIVVASSSDSSMGTGIDAVERVAGDLPNGAVHVFERRPEGWAEIHFLKSLYHPMFPPEVFGGSVALCRGALVVGAPFDSSKFGGVGANPANDELYISGAVWLFQ